MYFYVLVQGLYNFEHTCDNLVHCSAGYQSTLRSTYPSTTFYLRTKELCKSGSDANVQLSNLQCIFQDYSEYSDYISQSVVIALNVMRS